MYCVSSRIQIIEEFVPDPGSQCIATNPPSSPWLLLPNLIKRGGDVGILETNGLASIPGGSLKRSALLSEVERVGAGNDPLVVTP